MSKHDSACLDKAGNEEPIFVLRAKDLFAIPVIEVWLMWFENLHGQSHPKAIEARMLVNKMLAWQGVPANGARLPD